MNAPPQIGGASRLETMPQKRKKEFGSVRELALGGYVLALIAAFGRGLAVLFGAARHSDLNSYIILVPLVSIYFFYSNRAHFSTDRRTSLGWALFPLIVGTTALFFIATGSGASLSPNDRNTLIAVAFVCFLWAGGFLFLGSKWMISASFPMFFLIFLVPLPDQMVDWMEMGLQTASAEAANVFFALTSTPALQLGTVFQLPGITLEVGPECSGIKSSWVLFITSVIAAKMFLARPWSRIVLVVCVIPLGILRNGFRIMVIGLLCIHDPDMIHSLIHRRGGPIFFALSLLPLLFVLWLLRRQQTPARVRGPAEGSVAIATGTK
jgi:exosortase C (VPDSG-CTERM-specific)